MSICDECLEINPIYWNCKLSHPVNEKSCKGFNPAVMCAHENGRGCMSRTITGQCYKDMGECPCQEYPEH